MEVLSVVVDVDGVVVAVVEVVGTVVGGRVVVVGRMVIGGRVVVVVVLGRRTLVVVETLGSSSGGTVPVGRGRRSSEASWLAEVIWVPPRVGSHRGNSRGSRLAWYSRLNARHTAAG